MEHYEAARVIKTEHSGTLELPDIEMGGIYSRMPEKSAIIIGAELSAIIHEGAREQDPAYIIFDRIIQYLRTNNIFVEQE